MITKSTKINWQKLTDAAYITHQRMIRIAVMPSCVNCRNWGKNGEEICTKFKVRPPAQIIAESCGKDWAEDIPF